MLRFECLEDRRLLAAGDLDTTFGIGGKVVQDLGIGKDEEIYASAVQSNGKIIVAGLVNNPGGSGRDFLVARFNSNGSLDTTFGTSGRFTMDVSDPGSGTTPNFDDSASDIAILGDGSILVSGSASRITGPGQRFNGVALVKLTSTGALDTTFGTGGKTIAILKNASNQNINVATANGSTVSIALQSDGRIVCGATTAFTDIIARRDFAVVRFNATGSLDTTFDGDGYVITDFEGGVTSTADDHLYDIAIQSDGKIVAVGDAFTNFVKPIGSSDFAVVRYNTNGSLDTTFNGTGFRLTDISPSSSLSADSARDVKIQSDGKIVVGGRTQNRGGPFSTDDFDFVMARYNANGTLDTTFGSTSEIPGTKRVSIGLADIAEGMVVQPDGKYVIAGYIGGFDNSGIDLGVARFLANGNLDTSFSGDGLQTAHFASTSFTIIGDLTIQPDAKILAAGFVGTTGGNYDIAMARFESGLVVQSISGAASVAEGSPYTLTLSSSDSTTTQWTITWGDGNVQTVPGNPSSVTHTYADGPNNYTISATITTSTGTSPVGNAVAVSVLNVSPTLSISGASSVSEGSPYTLNLTSSDPGTDTIASWTINWGDGIQTVMGNPASVTHTYADGNASRTISATATDEDGTFAAGNTVAVAVNNVAPILTISGAAMVNEGALYSLNLSSSDPGADTITSWTINWGNGSQVVSGNPTSVTHTYADGPNSYTISATATDEDGTFASNSIGVTVNNVAPTLTISGAASVNEGALYTLNLSAFDPGPDTITSWTINWGNGSQVVSGNPTSVTHTYADGPNGYTISATATDEDGTFTSNSIAVSVNNVAPTLTISGAASVNESALYTLNLSSFDPGTDTISSWTINWGDGSQVVSGNPASVTHTYADGPNGYTISATATDEDGTFAAGNTVAVTVNNVAPTLAISGAAAVDEGALYTLNLSSFDPGADTITSWSINWGDSTQIVSGNPTSVTHTYADGPNGYVISASATDEDGTFAAGTTVAVAVNNVAPTLTLAGTAAVAEGALYTLGLSSFDPGTDTITSWTINWGDSVETISGNPTSATHTYADGPNGYTISATATDEDGTFASNSIGVTVNNVAPALTISGAASVNEGALYTLNLSSFDPGADTITSWTINWGDGSQVVSGNPSSVTHTYADGPNGYTVSATATDEDGTFSSNSIGVSVNNVAPTTSDATFTIAENSPNGTVVGTVSANDPGNDTLSFSIVGGTGATAFAINSATGQITVADSSQLDFETTPSLTLNVQVSDGDGGFANANVTVNLVNLASVSGVVFVDVNHNGLFDANEPGIDGVVIKLLDQNGNAVLDEFGQAITETTSSGGFYLFDDIGPGTYQLFEMQPTGVTDGAEHLGSLGGTVVANDRIQLTLAGIDAFDYAFAEFGQQLKSGDAATIGFWQNKNGQALITQGGTQLAAWLTANFSNVFGNTLVGATGADVATFYRDQLFKQQSKKSAGPAKVDAQFMAVALATYFTSHNLAGSVAAAYGFNVTDTGIGTRIVNVGTKGAAFGVANGSDRTIMQLLLATDDLTDQPNNFSGFATVYDTNGNGVISTTEASLRTMANDLYSFINEAGGV